ncbi:uncharacterized protein B0T15DRAFT_157604 [Chaetomium strumarium]|uniref:Uncharacterized protein n=1 Tax=Chaetomium strumarium TaxID=1170767 RepID=A0AAJ0GVU0_9PEZI|nr:hypothetical protein B0T15DRAFT_157604 [Chaetomium strumarium]
MVLFLTAPDRSCPAVGLVWLVCSCSAWDQASYVTFNAVSHDFSHVDIPSVRVLVYTRAFRRYSQGVRSVSVSCSVSFAFPCPAPSPACLLTGMATPSDFPLRSCACIMQSCF